MKPANIPAYFKTLFDKYQYILLVCVAGLVLMLWPQGESQTAEPQTPAADAQLHLLENRIQTLLENMEGVGEATVLLTVEMGPETDYAFDRTETRSQSDHGSDQSRQAQLVTLSQSGGQSPVPLRTASAVYRGAVVACQGGGSAAVRLAVTRVIQSLTGISADRIVITKMK